MFSEQPFCLCWSIRGEHRKEEARDSLGNCKHVILVERPAIVVEVL